jgi:hypothetical protein
MITYPISSKYLSHWSIYDAIREFIQNALDSDYLLKEKTLLITYDYESQVLKIINKGILTKNTLLLGTGSKSENKELIGNYGEGYKLGALVLTRNKKEVKINSGDGILYLPSVFFDEDFQEEIFGIDELPLIKESDAKIEITIINITKDEYEEIINKCLYFQTYDKIEFEDDEILTDNKYKGCIFVKGLYVCTINNLEYGYNFTPGHITLNRDRNIASNFEVTWRSSNIWNNYANTVVEDEVKFAPFVDLLEKDAIDIQYSDAVYEKVRDQVYLLFRQKYGNNIPISSEEDAHKYTSYGYGYNNFTHVSRAYSKFVISSSDFKLDKERHNLFKKNMNPKDALIVFETFFKDSLNKEHKEAISEMILLAKNWRYKPNKKENGNIN